MYLEEISSTLSGTCYKLTKPQVPVAELIDAGFQAIETGMTEGHPCFVANNGRLGFGVHDYLSYAPETASPVRLVWLAAHRSRAAFTAGVPSVHPRGSGVAARATAAKNTASSSRRVRRSPSEAVG